ncbi:hypothetical protein GOBAR_AA07059 [Gossypium barbadense]|uniref:Uncharacterized protein n=1 Tax=Gossypium barbadense TaxID=3634 RepID=A0A2P5YD59_GOSBA|nr:hypothetical protein GOBAR_AA07059 [Gossypium barbadense]
MLLKDLYELNPVERVKVSRNSHGQPVGSKAQLLAGYLSIIARNANMLPINYESWHHMPDSNKNQALDNIKDRERVGTSSKQKQKFTYTVGSRNFASVAEAEEVSSGQKVGRLQLFEITHKKKDKSSMTSEAGEIMEKLKEKKAEYEAIALTDILGPKRYGQVRFQGSGVTPTQYFGSGSQQYMPSGSQAQAEVQSEQVEQIAEVQRKYELQQELRADAAVREAVAVAREAMAAAREAKAAAMAVEQSKKCDELQLQLQQMMQMFQ